MRLRLRESSEANYQVARSNEQSWEHQARTLASAGLISFVRPSSVLDLACGDGSLTFTAHKLSPIAQATFVDISEPNIEGVIRKAEEVGIAAYGFAADVEERLDSAILVGERYDLALLCEFLEHVPDPVEILRKTRQVATLVLASSPIIEQPRGDPNQEHVWAFDNEGYLEIIGEAGWTPKICENLMLREGYYNFQMWLCG